MNRPRASKPILDAPRGVLDPISRVSEVLFGLIMTLTFTGTLRAVAGRAEVHTMLVGAIGCNIAWGIVDAVMFLITRLTERGRHLRALRAIREASDEDGERRVLARGLPPFIKANLPEGALEEVRRRLKEGPALPRHASLSKADVAGAAGIFLWMVASTFPVAAPYMVVRGAAPARWVSNGIAVVMMFLCGCLLGRYAAYRPWVVGLAMALVGCVLVAVTVALGG